MGLLKKTGAGNRLKYCHIDIDGHELIIGLPGNLSNNLPTTTIQGFIKLNDPDLFGSDHTALIADLIWDYKLPLWKHFGEHAGFLALSIHVIKIPHDEKCNNIEQLELFRRKRCQEISEKFNFKFEDFRTFLSNDTEWLSFRHLPPDDGIDRKISYEYSTLVDQYHYIKCIFDIGFSEYHQEHFPSLYKQAMNDMQRIVNSCSLTHNNWNINDSSFSA